MAFILSWRLVCEGHPRPVNILCIRFKLAPSEVTKHGGLCIRGKQTDENGGVRWRSDEGDDDSGPGHSPPTRMKALTHSQGRTRSRFYSGRV